MKQAANLLLTLFLCLTVGTALAYALDVSAPIAVFGCVAASVGMSLLPAPQAGTVSAVVLRQMWETALITAFRELGMFLNGVPRKDQYVGNNVINITEIGADPDVLINNTTYPIATAQRTDDNVPVALYKYDTTNTKITDDELYGLPYDKPGSVVEQHRLTLDSRIMAHSLHSLCVSGDTANTPVLETTGADDGNGRRRLTRADLIALQLRLDNLLVPQQGRRLVLCNAHHADLLLEDATLNMPMHDAAKGKVRDEYYGFEVYKYTAAPVFNSGGAKKAFGAAGASGDRQASVVFLTQRSFVAQGTLKFYFADAANNPQYRESSAGFRLYSVTLPTKNTGFGAVISANV